MATKRKAGLILTEKEMLKRYGAGYGNIICLPKENTLWLPSRIPALNYHLGGGIMYGRILELFGEESTGKSLMAIDFGVVAQSLGGLVIWADAEGTFDGIWAQKNGLDLSKVLIMPEENSVEIISDFIADMSVTARSKLTNNEPIVLIVDSIAALDTIENIESSQEDSKAEMGGRASAIYKLLRRRNKLLTKYGICTICINQLRQKVGASKWEDPDTTPGGQAMRFYAAQRLGLYRGKTLKDSKDKRYGQVVYVRTKKNKLAPPKDNIQLQVNFREHNGMLGYHRYTALADTLLDLGVVKRKQARWYFKEKQIAHGDEKMTLTLTEDDDLRQKLLKRSGINTVSKTRAQLESISKNLYPVKIKTKNAEEE